MLLFRPLDAFTLPKKNLTHSWNEFSIISTIRRDQTNEKELFHSWNKFSIISTIKCIHPIGKDLFTLLKRVFYYFDHYTRSRCQKNTLYSSENKFLLGRWLGSFTLPKKNILHSWNEFSIDSTIGRVHTNEEELITLLKRFL